MFILNKEHVLFKKYYILFYLIIIKNYKETSFIANSISSTTEQKVKSWL